MIPRFDLKAQSHTVSRGEYSGVVERLWNAAAAHRARGLCQRLAALFSNPSLRLSPANTRERTENLT